MPKILISFICNLADAPEIAEALHADGGRIVHMRDETVFGHDFSDASAEERVTGQLKRRAVELIIDPAEAEQIVETVRNLKRSAPVRWISTPIIDAGRLP